ncbi:transmembrane protein, putative (macronuclear) [Tetrahymena thermophila SB210]|uniref:Transmembrane protein, putative n=1 Tax=Tetrahymena thermophila (strain SB210) TaxID=312017 RepID=I7M6Z7_TETTS|nr:transmembrane protein, putative [Tetrahymena thermophila SB210]EAR87550.2 transmembrane protein, putative [Tetrahymena thermophila SB210]|eukprot:XP_001007795.2 transmembrane protein, putative [Tetrahymena thermophila SB210]
MIQKIFKSIFKSFFKTMLEVIEDRPNFEIPQSVYIFVIAFYFFQLSGYIFCNDQERVLNEQLFKIFAHINEISTGTYLLSIKGIDTLTLVFFGIMQVITYMYYFYLFGLTALKKFYKPYVLQNRGNIKKINQMLNVFFTFYYWIFQIPFAEINISLLSCNQNSFLVEFRLQNCEKKSLALIIFASIGLALSIFTGIMIMFFFRNYEFFETNLLKRKFNKWQIPQLFSMFVFLYIYYISLAKGSINYIASQIVGVILYADLIINYPFRNSMISKLYIIGCNYFYVSVTVICVWNYDYTIYDTDLFYFMAFLMMLLSYFIYNIQNYQLENILHLTHENFEKLYMHLDFYLEELVRFGIDQYKNEFNRFKLFQLLGYHKQKCVFLDCYCKQTNFKDQKDNLNYQDLLILVDDLFLRFLNNKKISRNDYEREHLYLKYISFITNFRNNPIRAYHILKSYLAKYKRSSFYFTTISKVLSAKIEKQIEEKQDLFYKISKIHEAQANSQIKETVKVKEVEKTLNLKQNLLPLFISFVNSKIDYWQKVKNGFENIDQFSKQTLLFSKSSFIIKQKFNELFSNDNKTISLDQNAIVIKLISIYKCVVMNQLSQSYKYESQYLNLKKSDFSKPYFIINQYNLANQNVQHFLISISKERGKILGKKTQEQANLFGYYLKDFEQIQHIEQLIPPFISVCHNQLIENMIQRGASLYLERSKQTFAKDYQGFIFPINIYLNHFHQFDDDFCMFGVVLKLKSNKQYIIFDSQGKIQGFSKKIFHQIFKQRNNKTTNQSKQEQNSEIITLSQAMLNLNLFILMPKLAKKVENLFQSSQNLDQDTNNSAEYVENIVFPRKAQELSQNLEKFLVTTSDGTKKKSHKTVDSNVQSAHFEFKSFELFYQNNIKQYEEEQIYSSTIIKYKLEKQELNFSQNKQIVSNKYFVIEINNMKDSESKTLDDQNQYQNYITTFNQIEASEESSYTNSESFNKTKSPQITNNLQAQNLESVITNLKINNIPIAHNSDILDNHPTQNNLVQIYQSQNQKKHSIIISQEQLNQQLNNDTYLDVQSQNQIKSESQIKIEQHLDKYTDNKQLIIEKNDQKIEYDETQGSYKRNDMCSHNLIPLNSPTLCYEKALLSSPQQNGIYSPLNVKGDIETFASSQNQIDINCEKQRKSFKLNSKRVSFFKKNQDDNYSKSNDNQKSLQNLNNQKVQSSNQMQENGQKSNKKHNRQQEFVLRSLISNKNAFDKNELDAQRSQSYYSASSSFRSISNILIQNILSKTNTIFSISMSIFSAIYIIFFALMSLIIGIIILLNLQSFTDDVKNVQQQSGFFPLIANQTLNSFNRFQIDNFIIQDPQLSLYSSLVASCEQAKQLFLQEFNDRFQTTTNTYLNNQDTYYKAVTYLNNQQNFQTIDFIDLQFKVLQSSQVICGSVSKQKHYLQSDFYFLLQNMMFIYQSGESVRSYQFFKVTEKKQNLYNIYIYLGTSCLIITLIQIIASLLGLKYFNQFKSLILFLIGRINIQEVDIEIEKLKKIQDVLQDINQKWMNFDFVENMLFTQNRNVEEISIQQQSQNDQKISKNKQIHIQNALNLRQSQRKIISLVKNTSFNYLKGMIIIGFICLSGCVMIIGIILMSNQITNDFTSYLNLYKNAFETADQFSFVLLMSDYLSISPLLNQKDPYFPQATQQIYGNPEMYQQFSQYLANNKLFFQNILNDIDQQKQISEAYKSQIINLLQKDVCNSIGYNYDRMCIQNTSPTIRQILRQGTIALFTDIFQLFSSYDILFRFKQGDLFDATQQNQVSSYANSSYHLEYITYGFNIAANCLQLLQKYMNKGFQDYITSFIQIGYIYLVCLCLPFIVFWIILSRKIKSKVEQSIVDISFSLTLIPYEKLQEENTIIFLKKIQKY